MKINSHLLRRFQKQRGVALLIVMLIMALMTTVASTMSSRMFINFNRAQTQIRYQQAYWFGLAVEELGKAALKSSFEKNDTVTLSQPWAVRDKEYPVDDWKIKGNIFDKQACFNLNGLINIKSLENGENPSQVTMLKQLIESQGIDSLLAETAAASTWEYIDQNNNVQSSSGVEDSEYEGKKIPRVAANGFLSDVTEWRAVYGVSQAMYEKVAPFLCAIPSTELKINVNTLEANDAPLLAAILHPLSVNDARSLIEDRDAISGWTSLNSFFSDASGLNNENRQTAQAHLDIKSRFFESDIEIALNETLLRVRSLLQRSDDGKINVVRRRYGGASERNTDDTPE